MDSAMAEGAQPVGPLPITMANHAPSSTSPLLPPIHTLLKREYDWFSFQSAVFANITNYVISRAPEKMKR